MALTQDERARIHAEEIYRDEVRRALSPPQAARERLWTVLNSAFVIWLLGSVAVGLIAQWYAETSAVRDARMATQREKERLGTEILVRLSNAITILGIADDPLLFERTRAALNGRGEEGVYPEYRDTPLLAVMLQFRAASKITSKDPHATKFRELYAELEVLSRHGSVDQAAESRAKTASRLKKAAEDSFGTFDALIDEDRRLDNRDRK